MKSVIRNLKKDLPYAGIVLLIGITVLCICEINISKTTAVAYRIEMWIDSCSILDFFFPLVVSLPFSWKLYFEKKNNFINYVSVRTDKKKYIGKKMIAGMTVAFIMTFLIYYMGLLFAENGIKIDTFVSDNRLQEYLFGKMQAENPLVFGVFWCVWKGVVGAVICAFGYGVALTADNLFVISISPFLYCVIENFITGTLGLEQYSVCTSYILNRLSPNAMTISNYFIGVITFILFGSLILLGINYKKTQVN